MFVLFPPQPRQSFTPQLTPRRPLNLADQRASLIFESCETISITSLGETTNTVFIHVSLSSMLPHRWITASSRPCHLSGSEEDLFYDAPSSPIGDRPFFPDNPMPLRYADLHKRKSLIKEESQKNMTDFIMKFEISEVQRDRFNKLIL